MQTRLQARDATLGQQDLERIRLVTRHFKDLQGLRASVPWGIALIGLGLGEFLSGRFRFALVAVFVVGALWLRAWAGSHYRRTFGEVERRPRRGPFLGTRRENLQTTLRGLLGAIFFLAALRTESIGGCSIYLFGGWVLLDDWLRREQPLSQAYLPALAILCCGLAAASYSPATIRPILAHEGIPLALVAAAFVVAGLLDHRQLVQAMGLHGAPEAEASPAGERP